MWLNCKLINSEFHITLLDSSKNPEAYLDPMLQQYTFWLSSCFFFPCVCWLDFPHFPYFQASSRSPKWDLSLSCLPAAEQKVKLTSQSLIWRRHVKAIASRQFEVLLFLSNFLCNCEWTLWKCCLCDVPAGQRTCCISCRRHGKWSRSMWHWWGTPSERGTNKRDPLGTMSLCQR